MKDSVSKFASKVDQYRRSLEDILDDENLIPLMSLSRLKADPELYASPLSDNFLSDCCHEEIEELLAAALLDFSSLESKLDLLSTQMKSAEEMISLRLDTSRNELLIANTAISILSVCIAFSAYITGIFGMNLDNTRYIQPTSGVFSTVFCVTAIFICVGSYSVFFYLRYCGILPKKSKSPAYTC